MRGEDPNHQFLAPRLAFPAEKEMALGDGFFFRIADSYAGLADSSRPVRVVGLPWTRNWLTKRASADPELTSVTGRFAATKISCLQYATVAAREHRLTLAWICYPYYTSISKD